MSHIGITEAEAFSTLQAGDERGLNFFFNRYYASLVYYAQSITHSQGAAEEIASDAFVKLWHNCTTITNSGAIKPLLYRIVYNASIDYLREHQTRSRHAVRFAQLPAPPAENEALQKLAVAQTFHHIYQFLHLLPPRTRQIFILFYFRNQSHQEIARELGLTAGTVRNLKFRAVQILKQHIDAAMVLILLFSPLFS